MDCWKFCLKILLCNNFLRVGNFRHQCFITQMFASMMVILKNLKVSEDINIQTRYTANLSG